MRLLMAVSGNGFLCRDGQDDMSWTGSADKALFRALTSVGGVCAVGSRSFAFMPKTLEGRQLIPLSRSGYTLKRFQDEHPNGWLIGGPTVAKAALVEGLISEVHLCEVSSVTLGTGRHILELWNRKPEPGEPLCGPDRPAMQTYLNDVVHRVYRL